MRNLKYIHRKLMEFRVLCAKYDKSWSYEIFNEMDAHNRHIKIIAGFHKKILLIETISFTEPGCYENIAAEIAKKGVDGLWNEVVIKERENFKQDEFRGLTKEQVFPMIISPIDSVDAKYAIEVSYSYQAGKEDCKSVTLKIDTDKPIDKLDSAFYESLGKLVEKYIRE
jgi:hypothetical protein